MLEPGANSTSPQENIAIVEKKVRMGMVVMISMALSHTFPSVRHLPQGSEKRSYDDVSSVIVLLHQDRCLTPSHYLRAADGD